MKFKKGDKVKLVSYDNTFDPEMGNYNDYEDKAPLGTLLEISEVDEENWCRFKGYSYIYHPSDIQPKN